eukprot:5900922-Prymnesium_polylepis.1
MCSNVLLHTYTAETGRERPAPWRAHASRDTPTGHTPCPQTSSRGCAGALSDLISAAADGTTSTLA